MARNLDEDEATRASLFYANIDADLHILSVSLSDAALFSAIYF